jgi:hypothetical protein
VLALVALTLDAEVPLVLLAHDEERDTLPHTEIGALAASLEAHVERSLILPLGLDADPLLQVLALADDGANTVVIAYATLVAHRFVNAIGLGWHPLTEILPSEDATTQDDTFDPLEIVARLEHTPPVRALSDRDRLIVAHALALLRRQLTTWPALARLTPSTFTLTYLQRSVEALLGTRLHAQNFRRLVLDASLLEPVGLAVLQTTGRPAALYRFAPGRAGRLRDSLLHGARARR